LFGRGRITPEQVEGVVEHVLMFVTVDHRRAQRGACLGAVAEIDQRQRLLASKRFGRANRQARPPQQAREVHNIGGKGRGLGVHRWHR
jgi:hypothetical protein